MLFTLCAKKENVNSYFTFKGVLVRLTDKKRQNIIAGAIEEFQQHGFRGAKTTRIAQRANVSSRTLYKHFESKEALFDSISEMIISQKSNVSIKRFDPNADLEAQLTEALESFVKTVTEPEVISLTRMVTAEMLINTERSKAYYSQLAAYRNPITQLISEAMEAGAIRTAEPKYASQQLMSMIRDFFYTPEFMLGQRLKNDGVMSDCIKMFLAHYKV